VHYVWPAPPPPGLKRPHDLPVYARVKQHLPWPQAVPPGGPHNLRVARYLLGDKLKDASRRTTVTLAISSSSAIGRASSLVLSEALPFVPRRSSSSVYGRSSRLGTPASSIGARRPLWRHGRLSSPTARGSHLRELRGLIAIISLALGAAPPSGEGHPWGLSQVLP